MTKPIERKLITRLKILDYPDRDIAKTLAFLREDTDCNNLDKLLERVSKLYECKECGRLSYNEVCQCNNK